MESSSSAAEASRPIWLSYYVDGCRQVTHCALSALSMLTLNHSPLYVVAAGMSFVCVICDSGHRPDRPPATECKV